MNNKDLIDNYFETQSKVHDIFGYVEDWVSIPLDDARDYWWTLDQATYDVSGIVIGGEVLFAASSSELTEGLINQTGDYYSNEIYTQRFLPKWVYRTTEYTMICVDTHTDGNKFLQIFDNAKEVKL